jgi:hypothetical protein
LETYNLIFVDRRLQDDLAAALKDCRFAQRDLALSQREAEDLKQKLQDYVTEVERVEAMLSQKVYYWEKKLCLKKLFLMEQNLKKGDILKKLQKINK